MARLISKCAVCGKVYGSKPYAGKEDRFSHGYCPACKKDVIKQIRNMDYEKLHQVEV